MRIAAVGDVHLGEDAKGRLRPALEQLPRHADVLLLAGDLTRHGTVQEAAVVAAEFGELGLPVAAVLGNHEYHCDAVPQLTELLEGHGIRVLEGDTAVIPVGAHRLGIAGVKGFGGGFAGRCASAFGEREMKAFVNHTEDVAGKLRTALDSLDTDVRVALTHYAPIRETLHGEPPELYPFLGSYLLGEAIDATGPDLALHGHAHSGAPYGTTAAGVSVRNVAAPVLQSAFAVFELHP